MSNRMTFDATGKLIGFQDKTIHIMNKGAVALKGTANYDKVRGRKNVILLGDSPGCFAAHSIIVYSIFPYQRVQREGIESQVAVRKQKKQERGIVAFTWRIRRGTTCRRSVRCLRQLQFQFLQFLSGISGNT